MQDRPTRWGVIATGGIAYKLATAIENVPGGQVWSVVSRDRHRARDFADRFGAERHFDDLDAFAADPELDIVAVGTPHTLHYENTLACLDAGKHVLCEKPMGLNRRQVATMVERARARDRFLMEALWMWFIPAVVEAKRRVEAGEIGEPQVITADFGFLMPKDPSNRFYSLELGGGALLDIGLYPLALAHFLFGRPDQVTGQAVLGETGVDEQMTASLRWNDGRMANCTATIRATTTCEAMVAGTEGHLRIHRHFWHSERLTLTRFGKTRHESTVEQLEIPFDGNGYDHEIAEVERCLRCGARESSVMGWQDSLDLVDSLDALREQWGLRYPGE